MDSPRRQNGEPAGSRQPEADAPARRRWPRQARLLKRGEFEKVYSAGRRSSNPFFAVFLLKTEAPFSKVGFTAPRALGKAVTRNRIRRRMREAVRLHFEEAGPGWNIVFNPRRAVLEADFTALEREVSRLFRSLGPATPGAKAPGCGAAGRG